MGRKGIKNKHTAKELEMKRKAAWRAQGHAGGGASGAQDRQQKKRATAVQCEVCKVAQPNIFSMTAHFENRHPKMPFPKEEYEEKFNSIRTEKVSEKRGKGSTSKS